MAKKEEPFYWRTNPAVIAAYWLDENVPKGAEITLKPNEACVVIEDGRIIGVATQTKMEVNPQIGLLSRIFGAKNPTRSFLFVFLGPHNLMLRVDGRTSDGHEVDGVIGLRVMIEREDAAKLLQLPAKGESSIRLGHLVSLLEPELNNIASKEFMSRLTLAELRESPEAQEEIESSIRSSMRGVLMNAGMSFVTCWASWNQTENEQILKMQDDYENAARRHEIIEQEELDEMESIFRSNSRRLELDHRLKVAHLTQEAREEITGELASIQANSELDAARWKAAIGQWERKQAHLEKVDSAEGRMQISAQRDAIELAKLRVEEERIEKLAEAEAADEEEVRRQRARLLEIQNERTVLAASLEHVRDEVALEQDVKEVEFDREQRQLDAEASRAVELFKGVQEAKRARMAMEAGREDARLESHGEMSDKVLDVLGGIAGSGEASQDVKIEALRQLSELRKADISGSGDAYIDPSGDEQKKKP